jgi:hypothetical protein
MLNGHYNGEVRNYLLQLQTGRKPDVCPDIPEYWRSPVEQAESVYLRSGGDGEAVKRLLSTLCKINTDLTELLATERPSTPARVDEAPDAAGTELQEALSQKDRGKVFERISEIAMFDDITLARFKVALRNIFGSTFPMREFLDLLRAEKRRIAEQNRARPVIKSAYDLMQKQFPEKEWIVPGILPPGLIALAGKQKIGKSWLDYNLCLAIGGGGMAFGSIPVQAGDVLYMALEDNEQRLQDRFKQLLEPGQVMPSCIDYVTEWPRMDATGVAVLEEWIQSKPNPRLIIIDPWVKVKPRVKARQGETGYDADYEALEGIKRLADTYKVCILVQFHLRKAGGEDPFDELNGTSGITACADGFLSLKRSRGESDATLWGTGRDYREDVDLALKFDNGYWNVLGDAKEYALSKASKEIIDILNQASSPVLPKELAALLEKPEGTVRKRLFDMKNRGEVKDTGKGYISLLPQGKSTIEKETTLAQCGNGGNGVTRGSIKQGVEPAEPRYPNDEQGVTLAWRGNAVSASVTPPCKRYPDSESIVTAIRPGVEPHEQPAVTPLPPLPQYANDNLVHQEALVLLSEVQELFKARNGIRQMWRDDLNPIRQFLPGDYIKKVQAAIESGDTQSIQAAITAMKWTTGKLRPGRDKEASPLQG